MTYAPIGTSTYLVETKLTADGERVYAYACRLCASLGAWHRERSAAERIGATHVQHQHQEAA